MLQLAIQGIKIKYFLSLDMGNNHLSSNSFASRLECTNNYFKIRNSILFSSTCLPSLSFPPSLSPPLFSLVSIKKLLSPLKSYLKPYL